MTTQENLLPKLGFNTLIGWGSSGWCVMLLITGQHFQLLFMTSLWHWMPVAACYGFKFDRNIRDGSSFIRFVLVPPEVLFDSVCALFESALCLPCCSRQDAVTQVTKDIDQVSTLIELYFMFNSFEFDIDNIFSQSGERFVFYMYFMPSWCFNSE